MYTHSVDWNVSIVGDEALLHYIAKHDAKYLDVEFARGRQYFTDWYLREVYDNFLTKLEADTACLAAKKHKNYIEDIERRITELYKQYFEELPEYRYAECEHGRNRLGMIIDLDHGGTFTYTIRDLLDNGAVDDDVNLPLTVDGIGVLAAEEPMYLTSQVVDDEEDFVHYKSKDSTRKTLRELMKYGPGGRRLDNRIIKDLFCDDADNELTLVNLLSRIKRWLQLNVRGTADREAAVQSVEICMSHAVKVCMAVESQLESMRLYKPQHDYIEAYKKKREDAAEAEAKTIEHSVQAVQNLDVGKEMTCPKCYGAVINGKCTACGRVIHKKGVQ